MKSEQLCKKFKGKFNKKKDTCKINGFNMDIGGERGQIIFGFKPDTQQFKTMSPKEFLDLVPRDPFESKERRKKLKKIIKEQKSPVDPLWFDVDVDNCRVLRHEGRGRANASKELGLKKVPVVIFNQKMGEKFHYPTTKKNKCKKFLPQRS